MKTNIIKLGTIVNDAATGLDGMLTLLQVNLGHAQLYHFQPRALSPETGHPIKGQWLPKERFTNFTTREAELPMEVLGTLATDKASGFSGKVVNLYLHISGCLHIDIQPPGVQPKTGQLIEDYNIDIRRCEGLAIPVLTEEQLASSQEANPSPVEVSRPSVRG